MDEAEALLFDLTAAHRAFKVSQVNEVLTWMEGHALPFLCTTNLPGPMDAAVPRRFTLMLRFEALDRQRAALAFRRIKGASPPGKLPGGLRLGDFATVRRKAKLFGETRSIVLLHWLAEEREARQGSRSPTGFRVAPVVPERRHFEQAAVAPPVAWTGRPPCRTTHWVKLARHAAIRMTTRDVLPLLAVRGRASLGLWCMLDVRRRGDASISGHARDAANDTWTTWQMTDGKPGRKGFPLAFPAARRGGLQP